MSESFLAAAAQRSAMLSGITSASRHEAGTATLDVAPAVDFYMLDAPIIDPYSESDDDPGWLRSYKKLIREDYQTAEAIWAGVIVTTFIFFAQQMVRAYKSTM